MRPVASAFVLVLVLALPVLGQAKFGALGFSVRREETVKVEGPGTSVPYPGFNFPDAQYSWPNGRYLLFMGKHPTGKTAPCPGLCLWSAAKPTTATLVHSKGFWPIWSPDETFFAFTAPRYETGGAYPFSIYIYQREPLRLVRRLDVHVHAYAWSPDYQRATLLFSGPPDNVGTGRPPVSLSVYDVRKGVLREVERLPWLWDTEDNAWWVPEFPGFSWSPDGRYFVYSLPTAARSTGGPTDADLFVASADGTTKQRLTFTPGVIETWPRWVARDRITIIRESYPNGVDVRREEVTLHLVTPRAMLDDYSPTVLQPLAPPRLAQPPAAAPSVGRISPEYVYAYCWATYPNPCLVDIGVDAGHCLVGDKGTPGINGASYPDESDLNLAVSNDFVNRAGLYGLTTIWTRRMEGPTEPCLTLIERARIFTGEQPAFDNFRYFAPAAISVNHNGFGKSTPYGTEAVKHYQSQSPLPQAIIDKLYLSFTGWQPLSSCNKKRDVVLATGPKSNGWAFVSYLFDRNIRAVISEAVFLTNPCQWDAVTFPQPVPEDPNRYGIRIEFIPYETRGLADAILSCWTDPNHWKCGPR